MDGAAYPLLEKENWRSIYIIQTNMYDGWVTHQENVGGSEFIHKKALISSSRKKKLRFLPRLSVGNQSLPKWVHSAMHYQQTNSGNNAVYAHDVVHQLTTNPQVLQLHCLARYVGEYARYAEEYIWGSSMNLLGFSLQAKHNIAGVQFWVSTTNGGFPLPMQYSQPKKINGIFQVMHRTLMVPQVSRDGN
jgi:hypothetical protein